MRISIERAEEIVNCGSSSSKKSALMQKQSLYNIIKTVESKREMIRNYMMTVDIITKTHAQKKHSLEQLIHQLADREQDIDQGLLKISHQQKELEKRQSQLQCELNDIRTTAEKYRDKRHKCEQQYHAVASLPILSLQSKKRYLKARDKTLEAEQQVSEMRSALDKCQEHLRLISKTLSAHQSEQSQLSTQRRGSIDTIRSTSQQLEHLKQGCEFWQGFDTYQAQIVLESATYLYDLDSPIRNKNTNDFDIHQVWIKTFLLACFEYGDREIYGDTHYNPATIKIDFCCSLCQISQLGWPRVVHQSDLACEFCYNTTVCNTPTATKQDSRMKKIVSHLFSSTKITPIM